MNNTNNECEIVYSEEGYRTSHRCAICGEEMFPCLPNKKYCGKQCSKIALLNNKNKTKCKNMKELEEYYKSNNKTYNNKYDNKPVYQFRKDGTYVRRLNSAYQAKLFGDEKGKFQETAVARCARGERITYRQYIWIYEEEYSVEVLNERLAKVKSKYNALKKPIIQLDKKGNYIDRFDSITQARDTFLLSTEMSLINHMKGRKWCSTCVGYIWMYEEDYIQKTQGA